MRNSLSVSDFERWIDELVAARYGAKGRLAALIGMTDSAFGRSVRAGSLGVEALLKLARVVDVAPGEVLRIAGKGAIADLIDELYAAPPVSLTKREMRLLDTFRHCEKAGQDLMIQAGEVYRLAAGTNRARPDPT